MINERASINDYIAKAPDMAGPILAEIRTLVIMLVPQATETMSYKLPAFRDGKIFFYYAAFKNHIGIYPPLKNNSNLIELLGKYRGPKGNLKFPYAEEMPYELIAKVILALHQQYVFKK